jgi:RNA polymerase sigma-32 factor
MTKMQTRPIVVSESNISRYFQQTRTFPMLDAGQEYMLARRWREHGDIEAAHQLVTSHLRLVAKIAMSYRGYGLPISDLISEGNVGMMQAVKRFEPDRGFRLATYAVWWIRAAIQEYILHSWSLVKIGTTAAQKKLFFNLRKLKSKLQAIDEGDLSPENVEKIAADLNVSEEDVINMNRRLAAPDHSLNAPTTIDGDGEWQDWLVDEADSQEMVLAKQQELSKRGKLLSHAMKSLNVRERHILIERRLKDEPATLETLSKEYGVTRERVRQIEVRAFEKIQRAVKRQAIERANRHDGDAVGAVRSIQRQSLAASSAPNGEL